MQGYTVDMDKRGGSGRKYPRTLEEAKRLAELNIPRAVKIDIHSPLIEPKHPYLKKLYFPGKKGGLVAKRQK